LLFVPVVKEFLADTLTPISMFEALRKDGARFLLESVEKGERWGRYSMIGINPVGEVLIKDSRVVIRGDLENVENEQKPLEVLRKIIKRYAISETRHELPPFAGGLAGFLSYDTLRYYERLPKRPKSDLGFPDAHFFVTTEMVIYDHLKNTIKLVYLMPHDSGEAGHAKALARIEEIARLIKSNGKPDILEENNSNFVLTGNFTKRMFMDAVVKAKERIVDGDILQVVIARQLKCTPAPDPFLFYRRLRSLNPSPYMFFMDFKDYCIVGSSPECLAKLENGIVETHPIAGTRPRGKTAHEEQMLSEDLLNDEKEKAEHTMLVDLGRNDIGRVSKIGTVKVEDFMHIEKFSHVMHLVSRVKGQIDPRYDAFDALLACFPAGTVTGAPRIRAMEIIDELEPDDRGPYAGAVGYFDFRGTMDTCITIRSIFFKGNCAYLQAGAGIVADSKPENEYYETENKLGALIKAMGNIREHEAE